MDISEVFIGGLCDTCPQIDIVAYCADLMPSSFNNIEKPIRSVTVTCANYDRCMEIRRMMQGDNKNESEKHG